MGILIAIAGLVAFPRFRALHSAASASAADAKLQADTAKKLVEEIVQHKHKPEKHLDYLQRTTARAAAASPDEASQAAEAVSQSLDASSIDKAIGRALSLQKKGQAEDAVEMWRAIARIAEASSDTGLAARASASSAYLLRENNPEEALADYTKAIGMDPEAPAGYFNRGNSKARLGHHEEAIEDFTKAIELDPEDSEAYFLRAGSNSELGRNTNALRDLKAGHSLRQNDEGDK